MEVPRVSGALNEAKLVSFLSKNIIFLGLVPSPGKLMLPLIVVLPASNEPLVEITVSPVISAVPLIVPPVIIGVVIDLLVKVSTSSRVTMIPLIGKVAFEGIPVPPLDLPRMLLTAVVLDRSIDPNSGAPPSLGIIKVW